MTTRNIIWTNSDSIGQGYGDINYLPTITGVPIRLITSLSGFSASNPTWSLLNLGMSGFTSSQHFNRLVQIYNGTPSSLRPTLLLYDIYSPNGMFTSAGVWDYARLTSANGAWATALSAEAWCATNSIAFIPQTFGASLYGPSGPNFRFRDELLYPAISRWGSKLLRHDDILQDPAVDLASQGQQWLASYTTDGTHPNQSGYDAIGSGGSLGVGQNLVTRFLACATAVGVT